MKTQISKPNAMIEEHIVYLDRLVKSGLTRLTLSWIFLFVEYKNLSRKEAREICLYWARENKKK